ncbi:uncharacterized protein BX664DRAFT_325823 [Halteromyces radiatus]|uniref:uncharacterized protein n=1 Tax=Halteromyces radiatus TaxID=101107 RepID=UPI00221E6593|nr:uncharacterized protein BX664DRAFT_325823 [Halteromyces radiatus]KAI8097213.1 hypothetical protein BX664DRAFT_325823 [Halteromyces radiatus]
MSGNRVPLEYRSSPSWPALYWPFGPGFDPIYQVRDIPHTLYYLNDIWKFTMIWSVLLSLVVYIPAGLLAFSTLAKSRTLPWYILILIPFIFAFGGALASFIIGGIVGVALAFVYTTGFFVMSTWIPFLWALIHILVVVVGGYSTITAIL